MKIRTVVLILLACTIVNSGCQRAPGAVSSGAEKAVSENQSANSDPLEIYETNLIASQHKSLRAFNDATRYEIELKIDESLTSYFGHQEVYYTNNEDIILNELYFNLNPNTGGDYLVVENIMVNNTQVKGSFAFKNSALEIVLNVPLLPGETVEISMDFSGTVPEQMGGNYGLYIFQDDILALDSFFPIIPVYDEGGWNVQDPPRNADLIYTDAAFFEVRVEVPKSVIVVASGNEIDKQIMKDHQIITFVGGPQRDFYLAASPRYKSESRKKGEVKITSYYPEEFRQSGEIVLATAIKALQVFSERYGFYPYTEFDLVSTPMQAGGMEYSGAAAMALGLYGAGNTAGGSLKSDFLEFAAAHEVAHQWFFNQVMSDQIEEPWLDEGMAQYLTYVYYMDTYGSEAADQIRATFERYWSRAQMQAIPVGKPSDDYEMVEYAAIIYGRAPLFILELEKKMGEVEFTHFLSDYVSAYQWKTVNTQQFQSLAQETCDCDLTELFDAWWAFD